MKILLIVSLILLVLSGLAITFITWSRKEEYLSANPDLTAKIEEIESEYNREIEKVKQTCAFIINTRERLEKFVERYTVVSADGIKINMVDRVVNFKDGSDIDLDDITSLIVVNDKYTTMKKDSTGEHKIEHNTYTLHIATNYTANNIIKVCCNEDREKAYRIRDDIECCQNETTKYELPADIKADLEQIEEKIDYLFSLNIGDISDAIIDKNFELGLCNKLHARCSAEIQKVYKEHKKSNTTRR